MNELNNYIELVLLTTICSWMMSRQFGLIEENTAFLFSFFKFFYQHKSQFTIMDDHTTKN